MQRGVWPCSKRIAARPAIGHLPPSHGEDRRVVASAAPSSTVARFDRSAGVVHDVAPATDHNWRTEAARVVASWQTEAACTWWDRWRCSLAGTATYSRGSARPARRWTRPRAGLSAGLAGATPVCQGGVSPLGSVRDGYGGSVGVGLYGLFVAHRDRAEVWRTAVVPVVLTGVDYRRAHEACHKTGLLWNELVAAQRKYWESVNADPSCKDLRRVMYALDPALLELHSHTKQAVVDDLLDSVATSGTNGKAGLKVRAPHRLKAYRPLSFTRSFGWRVTPQGRLGLSLGRGRARIVLPLSTLLDPATGLDVPPADWGELRLCWDRDGRRWALHIAVPTQPAPALDPIRVMGVDEGIINPMTIAVQTPDGFDAGGH